jgi:hypothetical protein
MGEYVESAFMKKTILPAMIVLVLLLLNACTSRPAENRTVRNPDDPADNLPEHITRLAWFGQRADWSHDGSRILFLVKTF